MQKTNYHTHSTFCDGNDTPEQMARTAWERGFSVLGFSSHSMYPFASTWHIESRQHQAYADEIRRLRAAYAGKMEILLGFEADYIPSISPAHIRQFEQFSPDFIIGSVHYIFTKDGNFTIDDSTENVRQGIDTLFAGNGRNVVCEYFALQREMLKTGKFTIWGHPDVIRKRNGQLHFFDETDSWYVQELKATAAQAAKAGIIAEINTGGIARGAIDDVYPSAAFLQILHDNHVPVTLSSDAHSAKDIDCAFDRALAAAKHAGYTEIQYISGGQICCQPLKA